MELSTLLKTKDIAVKSGWELFPTLNNKSFRLIKTSGTGVIKLNISESWVDIETNEYFDKKRKEEKDSGELGYYSFLYEEAKDLMKLFENTFEFKASLIFENILCKLQNGCKIKVLNKKRHVEIKGDKAEYIKKRIRKVLKSDRKQAVFQIIY